MENIDLQSDNIQSLITCIISTHIIRSKTIGDEYCKQKFQLIKIEGAGIVLNINKLVLTSEFELYEKLGYKNLKQLKDRRLYKQVFGIKIETLVSVLDWLNDL